MIDTLMRRGLTHGFDIASVRAHWDEVVDLYDSSNESIGYGHTQRFEHGIAYFTGGSSTRLLNIWARMGEAIPYLKARFPDGGFVHLEASEVMLERARVRFEDQDFRQTDLTRLELATGSFDKVLSLETLEHCPNPVAFIQELFRVLRPGGELVLSCPSMTAEPMLQAYEMFFENHGEGPHRFPWSWEVKWALKRAGFELLEHRGTVFLPVIPDALAWLDRGLARVLGLSPIGELGIRQFYYCRKPA